MLDCVRKGLRGLFRNKLRSFLTIGGISIGVLSVVVISSIGSVGKVAVDKEMTNMGMDSLVVSADKSNNLGLCMEDLVGLKSENYIENAMPLMNFYSESKVLENTESCMVWGVNEDANDVIELVPIYGRLINKGDLASGANVCIIDEQIALKNYKRANIVGKKIAVNINGRFEDFVVVGVVKNGVNLLQNMLGEFIPSFVYLPYTTLQAESSQYYFNQIAVKIKDGTNSDGISEKIRHKIMAGRDIPANVSVENLLKQKSKLNDIMGIITTVLSIIAGISLVVSGLSIMTVMLVSVNERTREIGIKKSIGATNGDILKEFLIEAMLITFLGGAVGCLGGVGISALGCLIFSMPMVNNFSMIIGILAFSVFIGLIFGAYPAISAAKLKPVDALRAE
ncbi:MAG: ABC transporter permease [Oscillospiraceae bacterium]